MTMKVLFHSTIAAILLAPAAASGAVSLTLDTFDENRGGRNAFIKFQAPW